MTSHIVQIATDLKLSLKNIAAVTVLLEAGNTVPFIARYRKEATGNLDETEIRAIQEKLQYLQELEKRRETILSSIETQGKLTPALAQQIRDCNSKNTLEDLYLPYKPKRRTRAAIAKEKGLEPLALLILEQPLHMTPEKEALAFIDESKDVASIESALSGASDIVAEIISENATIRSLVREVFATDGIIVSKVAKDKDAAPTKFEQYYDFKESAATIPSHRYLAIRRGEKEGVLDFHIKIDPESVMQQTDKIFKLNPKSPFAYLLETAVRDAFKRLILPSVETDCRVELKIRSDEAAVGVFAENLKNLLLASPLGQKTIIGIDPGLRTGCKCAAVDETGKYLDTITIFLCSGTHDLKEAKEALLQFIKRYKPFAIGIGNGTGGRETEAFTRQLLAEAGLNDIIVVSVSEAGASVYSASDTARDEFPNLDLTIRGAISIARRLQDPLAELVKVDPKAIGVGQYQHDVYQQLLHDKLNEVVESCVNYVGVELNTASAQLLANVAGVGPGLALKIVKYRETHGAFKSRHELLNVSGLGPRTFEQAAGFLRVRNGTHPLDNSAVHPERYSLVEMMAKDLNVPLNALIAHNESLAKIDITRYFQKDLGEITLKDIISELKKPGRDPRAVFEKPCFREDVQAISDLKIGMKLEGIVTNVAAFGAFVDIGVHQDGLIHISELSDRFIKDPSEVVQVGNKITVEVLTIDAERKRISLTAKLGQKRNAQPAQDGKKQQVRKTQPKAFGHNPFARL